MARILLIEDQTDVLESVAALLRTGGHSVETASSGEAALRLFESTRPELVITDILMPDMDGLELIHRLRDLDANVKVIAVSGAMVPQYLRTAKLLGAVRVLSKPFTRATLLFAVDTALAPSDG